MIRLAVLMLVGLCVLGAYAHGPHDTILALAVSETGNNVYAVVRGVLFASSDGGQTWIMLRECATISYLAVSPSETLYLMEPGGGGASVSRTTDLVHWESLPISPCTASFTTSASYPGRKTLLRRTTFVAEGRALIAGKRGVLHKELVDGSFSSINAGLGSCPALAAVDATDTVYAGGSKGLMLSTDGGITWEMIIAMEDINQVVAKGGEVFVMTTDAVCRMNALNECVSVNLPAVEIDLQKKNDEPSPPTDIDYYNGTLFVLRRNSYAIFFTNDFGATWNNRGSFLEFLWEGEIRRTGQRIKYQDFTHVDNGVVGTFYGLHSTENGGVSWTYHPTINTIITTLSLSGGASAGEFHLALCTYAHGCFQGTSTPTSTNLQETYPRLGPVLWLDEYYNGMYLSPNYAVDSLAFRLATKGEELIRMEGALLSSPVFEGFEGTEQGGGIVFPRNYDGTSENRIYMYGFGGSRVSLSTDGGNTFASLWDGDGYEVVKMELSPDFSNDGTMVCLAHESGNIQSVKKGDVFRFYLSEDFGSTWKFIVRKNLPWRDMKILYLPGDSEPSLLVLRENGKLFLAEHMKRPFMFVRKQGVRSVRAEGVGTDGIALAPDGSLLAAAWRESGLFLGGLQINANANKAEITEKIFSEPTPFDTESTDPPLFFYRRPEISRLGFRHFSTNIAFSPYFATDQTIFAVNYDTIYKSTDKGRTWKREFSVPPGGSHLLTDTQ